jgi:hypothetical protein
MGWLTCRKEFLFNFLISVYSLNEVLAKARPNQTENFKLFSPRMPVSSSSLYVALYVKNESGTERKLNIFKQLPCGLFVESESTPTGEESRKMSAQKHCRGSSCCCQN